MNTDNTYVNKLTLLFVLDKMEIPLTTNTIIDMCCTANNWLSFMDCHSIISKLIDDNFITNVSSTNEAMYSITPDGRECLAGFFSSINTSVRAEISQFVKEHRKEYKRKQECFSDYFMNKDGTFTVSLKIIEPVQPLLELKFVVASKKIAKDIHDRWENMAEDTYRIILEHFIK